MVKKRGDTSDKKHQRVQTALELIIRGIPPQKITPVLKNKYGAKDSRTFQRDIAEARKILIGRGSPCPEEELGLAVERLNDIFARASRSETPDYKLLTAITEKRFDIVMQNEKLKGGFQHDIPQNPDEAPLSPELEAALNAIEMDDNVDES